MKDFKPIYSIYDKVACLYSKPLPFENEACAKRYFNNLVAPNKAKDDYELYYIGEFSFDSGEVRSCDKVLVLKGDQVSFVGDDDE